MQVGDSVNSIKCILLAFSLHSRPRPRRRWDELCGLSFETLCHLGKRSTPALDNGVGIIFKVEENIIRKVSSITRTAHHQLFVHPL